MYHFRNEPYEHLYIEIQKNILLCAYATFHQFDCIYFNLILIHDKQHAKNEKEQKYEN